MSNMPTPKADAQRAMREADWQDRIDPQSH